MDIKAKKKDPYWVQCLLGGGRTADVPSPLPTAAVNLVGGYLKVTRRRPTRALARGRLADVAAVELDDVLAEVIKGRQLTRHRAMLVPHRVLLGAFRALG